MAYDKATSETHSNFLLDVVVAHHKLSINQDIGREEQGNDARVCKLHSAVVWEECRHEAKQNHRPKCTEEIWHPIREVILGLAGKECETDEESSRKKDSLQDNTRFVE